VSQQSAIICHAPEDAALAGEVAAYLESNCALTVSQEQSLDLIDAVEIGLSADIVLVALSPASVPNPWKREKWEPVFLRQPAALGTRLACLLLRECRFPELFRRGTFLDLSGDALAGMRALKRWVYGRSPSVAGGSFETLRRRIADRPAVETGLSPAEALAFCRECGDDFEGVFQIDCARRSRAGILGDVARVLGLRLPHSAERNREILVGFCAGRRCLFVFDRLAEEDLEFVDLGGKTSIIITQSETPERRPLEELVRLFASWPRNPDDCLDMLGDAHSWLRDGESQASTQLGSAALAILKNFDRLAEACEILDLLVNRARAAGDLLTAHRLLWEQSTIRGQWGETVVMAQPVTVPEATQLPLEFGGPSGSDPC
jgi:TIR domain-containing protein